jgi:NADH-quinone oxidoreductase subunit M
VVAALLAALLLPAVAGTALVVSGRGGRPSRDRLVNGYALAVAVVTAVLVVVTVVRRPVLDRPWIPSLGVRWHFAVDGISAPLLVLTAVLGVAVVLHARSHPPAVGSGATFHGCLLLVEFGALATFLTRDAVLFFVAFEVVLVPMWVLISRFGDAAHPAARRDASGRFVLYTVLGSTLMLVGILALVGAAGTADLSALAAGRGAGLTRTTQVVVAALLLTGLGIKVPLWPVHTWLPPAHTVAPTAGSVLLAAVLLKMGTYGIVRLVLAPLPDGFAAVSPVLAVAGVIGILWGGLACLVENDLKRLVAYSSVAHMGFVALGLASGTTTGVQAALFANVAHGIVSALLFFLVGGLKDRWGSADLRTARAALREVSPRLGFVMVVGFAATLGLPGLIGFWGEFLAMFAAWSPAADRPLGLFRACAVLAVLGTGLAAAYSLRVLRTVWAGERTEPVLVDARGGELAVLAVLVVAVVALGVLPGPLLQTTIADVTAITTPGSVIRCARPSSASTRGSCCPCSPPPRAPRPSSSWTSSRPGCAAPTT